MYYFLQKSNLAEEYEKFMLNDKSKDLGYWLREHKIKNEDINKWTKYELDCGDAIFENKKMEIIPFIKDVYGKPYIPGSSIKGMLRTILLCYDILNNKNAPLFSLCDYKAVEKLLITERSEPWYGQLMRKTAFLAYLYQIDYWSKEYKIEIEGDLWKA